MQTIVTHGSNYSPDQEPGAFGASAENPALRPASDDVLEDIPTSQVDRAADANAQLQPTTETERSVTPDEPLAIERVIAEMRRHLIRRRHHRL